MYKNHGKYTSFKEKKEILTKITRKMKVNFAAIMRKKEIMIAENFLESSLKNL